MKRTRTALPTAGVVVLVLTAVFLASSQGHLDTAAPSLRVDPPPGPVSGRIGLAVAVHDDRPGVREVVASVGPIRVDLPLAGGTLTLDTTLLEDGEHELVVTAIDQSWSRNTAELRVPLQVLNHPPPPAPEPPLEPPGELTPAEPTPPEPPPAGPAPVSGSEGR